MITNFVQAGHSYKYRVKAFNRVGESGLSAFSDVIVAANKPARPDQPRFVASTSDSITLQFDEVEDNGGSVVTHYNLYISEHQSDSYTLVESYDGFSQEFTIQQA